VSYSRVDETTVFPFVAGREEDQTVSLRIDDLDAVGMIAISPAAFRRVERITLCSYRQSVQLPLNVVGVRSVGWLDGYSRERGNSADQRFDNRSTC
jgi:hypothetical protein